MKQHFVALFTMKDNEHHFTADEIAKMIKAECRLFVESVEECHEDFVTPAVKQQDFE